MILTTTPNIEGFKIIEYKGIVSAVSVKPRSMKLTFNQNEVNKNFQSNIQNLKEDAFQQLKDHAKALKANAIVSIAVDFEIASNTTYLVVTITGTAVQVQ